MDKYPAAVRVLPSSELLEHHGLTDFETVAGGHTGALLYRCYDQERETKIVKLAVDELSESEVRGNILGYRAIKEAGAEQLLPQGVVDGVSVGGRPYLIMPDLGSTVSEQARTGDFTFAPMLDRLEEIIASSIREAPGEQAYGLGVFRDQLGRIYSLLVEAEQVTEAEIEELRGLDVSALASDKASLMLLDFTPDNVFAGSETVSFIDPWAQEVYLGSFIPSLAQFATLSKDVYGLSGAATSSQEFDKSLFSLGASLGLTAEQVRLQTLLGVALQYSLSGYVRLDSEPDVARYFIGRSKEAVRALTDQLRGL